MIAKPLKAIIVDDEPIARRIVSRYLEGETDIDVLQQCGNGIEAVEAIKRIRPELLFLDIQMPGMNGLQVLESLDAQEMPFIIFITAHDEYAVRAFEFHALDYLLKPYDEGRFKKAVRRAKEQIRHHQESRFFQHVAALLEEYRATVRKQDEYRAYPARLEIRSAGHVSYVPVKEISWIEAADNYVILHTQSGNHLMRESMNRLEKLLDPEVFLRVHRSTIVNVHRIREVKTKGFGYRVLTLDDAAEIRVSRLHKVRLEKMMSRAG